jgi:hypothetical protein
MEVSRPITGMTRRVGSSARISGVGVALRGIAGEESLTTLVGVAVMGMGNWDVSALAGAIEGVAVAV